jgi:maleamate amidohydrolase
MRDAGLLSKKMAGLEVFSTSNRNSAPLWLPELSPEVQERGEITLFRKFPSVFFGTNFATQLHALNVDTLVICGACTSGSVRTTTLDAMESGFRAMVFREGCADRTREIHCAKLFDLDAKYGDLVCSEEAMEKLRNGW